MRFNLHVWWNEPLIFRLFFRQSAATGLTLDATTNDEAKVFRSPVTQFHRMHVLPPAAFGCFSQSSSEAILFADLVDGEIWAENWKCDGLTLTALPVVVDLWALWANINDCNWCTFVYHLCVYLVPRHVTAPLRNIGSNDLSERLDNRLP